MSTSATCNTARAARAANTGRSAVSSIFSREDAIHAKSTIAAAAAKTTITGICRPRCISSDTTRATRATVLARTAVSSVAAVTFHPVDTSHTGHAIDRSALAAFDGAAVLNLQ
jgi:hypothetical protein